MAFLDLSPVGSEGLHTDRPPYQRKWSKLENLIFTKSGSWRSRPGMKKLQGSLPNIIAIGEPSLITEVPNPRSTTGSGGKIVTFSQTIYPTGLGVGGSGFTPVGAATDWEVLDDNPPDNFATLNRYTRALAVDTSTKPGFFLSKTAVSTEFENIDYVTVRGRVRITGGGPMTFRSGLGINVTETVPTSAFLNKTFTISGTGVHDYEVTATTDAGGNPIVAADVDDEELFLFLLTGAASAGNNFEADIINITVVGTRTEMAANVGLIGTSKVIVSNHALLEYQDHITAGYVDRKGSASLPTGRPMDSAILYGQIFAVNGEDQTYIFPNSSGNFYQLSGKPTGRTVASFAGRILVGWATSADGKTIPERMIFSVKGNGEDYTGVGSGLIDFLATPGGIVKLATFSDDLCMGYKEQGVWTIRRTGDDDIPFVPDVIDFETRCLALKTVKTTLTKDGAPIQLFLGRNALNGTSVFRTDGITVIDVGQGIHEFLNDPTVTNFSRLSFSFAEVDPGTGNYWLFISEGTNAHPNKAWVLDMRTYEWTSAALGYQFSTAGRWTLVGSVNTSPTGENKMALGKQQDGLAYVPDPTLIVDEAAPGWGAEVKETVTWETGDHRLTGTAQEQAVGYRLHVLYTAAADIVATISASIDGGVTYNTGNPYTLPGSTTEPLSYRVLDIKPIHGRRIHFRVVVIPALRTSAFEIAEMWVEAETAGTDA